MQLPDFALEHFFARWEFAARYMLGSSDAETHTLDELLALADDECRRWWNGLRLGYTEVAGHPLLRESISRLYTSIRPDHVGVFAGAEEAIFAFMQVSLQPGDHAVVTWPGYQGLYEVARAAGAEVTLLPLLPEEEWAFPVDRLAAAMRPRTRVVAINFPHNPTGSHIDRSTLEQIVALARTREAWLFSDEVYRFAEFDPSTRLPAAADLYERGVSLGVMSKAFGLAGLRVGWIACPDRAHLARLLAFKHYLTICNAAPSEVLATIALRARDVIEARNRRISIGNLAILDEFFDRWRGVFEWSRPQAGTIAFPRLVSDMRIDTFAEQLATTASVLVLPGTVFGHDGNHFRLGFGRRDMPEALRLMEGFALQQFGAPAPAPA